MVGEIYKILFLLLITPLIFSLNCTNSTQSFCGLVGGSCASYKFINGSCIPSTCPLSPDITVWSNSSFNCIPCFGASKSICQSSCIQHKFYYDTSSLYSSCTTCASEYGISCTTCDSLQCKSCENGTKLSNDNQSCVDPICNIPHCIKCTNNTCSQCEQYFHPYKNTCVCFIPNCQFCEKSTCLKCHSGYYLDTQKKSCILTCIDNCKSCNNLKSCTTCSYGYYYTNQTNQCLPNCGLISPYCQSCYSTGMCTKCKTNYTVSINGKDCIPTCADQYCNLCSNVSKCDGCITGYKLNSSSKGCTKDVCSIRNCEECASASKCLRCKQYYALQNNNKTCQPNCGVTNCQFCQSSTTCKTCVDGFKIVDGSCTKTCSIQNCKLCLSEQVCFSCNRGYKLASNGQSCEYDCGIYKCLSCNSTSTCSVCYSGFTLSSNLTCVAVCQEGLFKNSTSKKCQPCPENCASCDGSGVCLVCRYLYYINNETNLACVPCSTISNCFACKSTSNVCTICKKGFYLVNSVCLNTTNYCSINNCLVCSTNTSCLICSQGFSLSQVNGTCQKIVCPSNQYLVGSTCTCGPRSYIENEQCISCNDANCLTCTSSACYLCNSGYYASGYSCIACQNGCQSCDSTGCNSCKIGYVKKGSSCSVSFSKRRSSISRKGNQMRCMPGCQRCDLDQSQNAYCLQADSGYVLVAGNIFACDPSCLTCADSQSNGAYTICLSCPKRSILVYGTCITCSDANALSCSISNQSYSLTCSPGYNSQNGLCNACSSNCLKCSSLGSGKCDVGGCQKGFFQSKDQYKCIKCFNGCTVCDSNPNNCLDCGDFKYLKNNICYSCPSNCLKCSNGSSCTICNAGYLLAADGSCKQPNIYGCIEYDANVKCLGCDQFYTLTNNSCIFNMSCNNNKTCSSCGYNYYLSSGSCLQCPNISNCNSCDQLNSTSCIECSSGYYIGSSKTCVACSIVGCNACSSNLTCTSAADGYYLVMDVASSSSGKVLPCGGLCATCTLSPLTCLSCKSGSSFYGTQCISDKNYKIKYVGYLKNFGAKTNQTADYQVGYMIGIFPRFFTEIGTALGYKSNGDFTKNSNFQSIVHQSIQTSFSANSDTTTNDPTTALTNTKFTDTQYVSVSVTNSNTSSQSQSNLALILGISIPLGVLLIVIIAVIKIKSNKDSTIPINDIDIDKEPELNQNPQHIPQTEDHLQAQNKPQTQTQNNRQNLPYETNDSATHFKNHEINE